MKQYPRPSKRRLVATWLTCLICIGLVAGSASASLYVQSRLTKKTDARFDQDTQTISDALVRRINDYDAVLYSARSYILGSQSVTPNEWRTFFTSQNTLGRYPGISSIYYVAVVPNATKQQYIASMQAAGIYQKNYAITPAGERDVYGLSQLFISANNVTTGIGFDVFSSPERKETYEASLAKDSPVASPPIKLATGPQGFFMSLPVLASPSVAKGYVALSFHSDDFTRTLMQETDDTIATHIVDVTDPSHPISLYAADTWNRTPDQLSKTDKVAFAGRSWQVDYRSARSYQDTRLNTFVPRIILVVGGLATCCVLLAYRVSVRRSQIKHLIEKDAAVPKTK